MRILAATVPTFDQLDRLEQQRTIEPDDHIPPHLEVSRCWDADPVDLIDQATPAPLPDDEDYPTRTNPDLHNIP